MILKLDRLRATAELATMGMTLRRLDTVTPGEANARVEDRSPMRGLAPKVIAVVAVIFLLREAQSVFIPLVLGILISYALNPVVRHLHAWHVPRVIGASLVLMLLLAGVGWAGWALSDDASRILNELPDAARRVRITLRDAVVSQDNPLAKMRQAASELQRAADNVEPPSVMAKPATPLTGSTPMVGNMLWYGSVGAATVVAQVAVILFMIFFLLASGDLYKRKVLRIATAALGQRSISEELIEDITLQIERFLVVRILTSVLVAFGTWLAFLLLGVQQAAVWGVAAGVLNIIPYFGPIVVALATAVVAFAQFGSLTMAMVVSGVSLLVTSLEGWLLTPWLTSRATKMNAVAVFVGLVIWGWIWGIWGAILAVPILATIKAVCDRLEDTRPIGELLGE